MQTYYLEGGYRAFSSYWQGRHADCVHGHVPYGLQVLTRRPVQYITMLREPVDGAVSFYYFVRESGRLNNHNIHPFQKYADSVSLVEFYQHPNHTDRQARYLAGMHFHRAYPYLHQNPRFRAALIAAAKKHLADCVAFGIQARFKEAIAYFQTALQWPHYNEIPRRNVTQHRPKIDSLKEQEPEIYQALEQANALDRELYAFAEVLFGERYAAMVRQTTSRSA
ncbi:MAG: sulfotransferase family 2 domain-containing protein [Chloroflexi bacterium]|nr:sulfotransferase family 2 domain-containing protein [Chloroflexota bacterium]